MKKAVTIVVPVYGDWPSLSACIDSLREYVDTTKHQIILVNDCGPEADLLERNIKTKFKSLKNFKYFRNPKNLGFVGTCNRAVLKLDKTDNDILLLNSDTEVTSGFLEEMITVLYSQKNIGVVSPRTNNATICTIPLSAIEQKGIAPNESHKLFQKYKDKFPRHNQTPTAHGFCMLIRRSLIKEYGLFDKIFGRGYGEEVDFCQRIARHGWLSALSNRAFVFHLEAKSFSLETKSKLLEKNNKIIRECYPAYKQTVTAYIEKSLIEEEKILGESTNRGTTLRPNNRLENFIRGHKKLHKLARAVNERIK